MLYPTITEYIASLKDAEDYFASKTDLRPVYKEDGMIHFTSGNFAVVFKMQDCKTQKQYAVKCFIKDQERRAESYKLISEELQKISSPYFVPYEYLEDELFVDSDQSNETEFPVVVMEWVDGVTLDTYVRKLCLQNDEEKLNELYDQFYNLASWLQKQPFAHGDLKHDNILVKQSGKLVLVDYDGMYVTAMCGQNARELGSPDYRHPNRTIYDFNENIDFFPLVTIALSLKVLSIRPFLYKQYATNDRLLLTEKDFRDIESSKPLKEISSINDKELMRLYSSILLTLQIPFEYAIEFSNLIMWDKKDLKQIKLKPDNEVHKEKINNHSKKSSKITDLPLNIDSNKFNWEQFCMKEDFLWTEDFIEKYETKLNWKIISQNKALPWSEKFIDKYKDRWEWTYGISSNTALPWNEKFIEKYKDQLYWGKLSQNITLPWNEKFIEKYKNKLYWVILSQNTALPWNEKFIEKYKDKWDYNEISKNKSISNKLKKKYIL